MLAKMLRPTMPFDDEGPRTHGPVDQAVEEIADEVVGEGHRGHRGVNESGVAEQVCELGLVGEAVEGRPGREAGRRSGADLLDGVEEEPG